MDYNGAKRRCFHMELKFEKNTSCTLAAHGKWGNAAAAWMGLSFFLRMVDYFGLRNLNDVPGGEIVFSVVLPLVISVGFILMLKLPRLNHPMAAAGLAAGFSLNYFLAEQMHFGGILSAIALLAMAGLVVAAVLGYIPQRKWLLWTAMGALGIRVLFVDLFGWVLPLLRLQLAGSICTASNLFGVLAIASLCAALELKKAE